MSALYAYSVLPVLAVALLLAFTALRGDRRAPGLAMYCLAVAAWCVSLLLCAMPRVVSIGQRLAAVGAFGCAGYLHAAYDATSQPRHRLGSVGYASAFAVTLSD